MQESGLQQITALRRTIERDRAQAIITGRAGTYSVQVQKILYYPYLWVHYEYDVKTVLGKRTIRAYVMVDLINNQAHTADRFETEKMNAAPENILTADVANEKALATAGSYLLHSSIHEMKALLCPQKRVVESLNLYKPFWIVRCINPDDDSFRVMVDAMTGKYQIIN